MPTGSLPASGKKLWEKVYDTALKGSCKDNSDPKVVLLVLHGKQLKMLAGQKTLPVSGLRKQNSPNSL